LFCATVIPGYDDRVIRKPGLKVDRKGGKFYEDSWRCAMSCNPQWILITSFNEWHEGAEIEPSKEHEFKYIKLTAKMSKNWKGK
jgi:hypothetical protein